MRHQKSGRHLNRTSAHRKAMLSNMSASLIEHETIKTTVVKAKELRRFVEPLITLSKVDSVANRRRAFAKLRSKSAVGKLFSDLGPRYQTRPGGYTRILKAGFRQGDSAMVAYMQLVDQPERLVEQEPEPLLAAAEPEADEAVEEAPLVEDAEVAEEQAETEASEQVQAEAELEVSAEEANQATDDVEPSTQEQESSQTPDESQSSSKEEKPSS